MQDKGYGWRGEVGKGRQERKGVSRRHPATEDEASQGACETTGYDGAAPGKSIARHGRAECSRDTQAHANRHSNAKQIPDEFGEARLRVLKHHGGTPGNSRQVKGAPGGEYPE